MERCRPARLNACLLRGVRSFRRRLRPMSGGSCSALWGFSTMFLMGNLGLHLPGSPGRDVWLKCHEPRLEINWPSRLCAFSSSLGTEGQPDALAAVRVRLE